MSGCNNLGVDYVDQVHVVRVTAAVTLRLYVINISENNTYSFIYCHRLSHNYN